MGTLLNLGVCRCYFPTTPTPQDMKRSVEDRATMMKESIPREDPEYQLIHDALSGCVRLQVEMSKAHRFTRIKYAKVYKELHEFVVEPVTYAKAVRLVGFNRQLEPLVDKLGDAGYAGAVIAKILVTLSTTAQESTTPEEQKYVVLLERFFLCVEANNKTYFFFLILSYPLTSSLSVRFTLF